MPLFALAAKEWLASKSALTPLGKVYYEQYSRKLAREFGERLVSDITLNDIAALQRKRLGEGLSARTVNCEVATLRQILKHCSCWMPLAGRVRFLRERADSGRALSLEEEDKLLDAISRVLHRSCIRFSFCRSMPAFGRRRAAPFAGAI